MAEPKSTKSLKTAKSAFPDKPTRGPSVKKKEPPKASVPTTKAEKALAVAIVTLEKSVRAKEEPDKAEPKSPAAVTAKTSEKSLKSPIKTTSEKNRPESAPAAGKTTTTTPSSTTALPPLSTAEIASIVKQPYEKVTPRKPTRRLKKWFRQKREKNRRNFVIYVVAFFGTAIVLALTMFAVGMYSLMFAHHRSKSREDHFDRRLTTKTELCRKEYMLLSTARLDIGDGCIHELEEKYGDCTNGVNHCDMVLWDYVGSFERYRFVRRKNTTFKLQNTDYADCGYLRWCRDGKCVPADVKPKKWWPRPKGDQFFVNQDPGQHIESTIDPVKECTIIQYKTVTKIHYDWFNNDDWARCFMEECKKKNVEYGYRLGFDPCDLRVDKKTGIRKRPCKIDHVPVKIAKCDRCPEFDPEEGKNLRKKELEKVCPGAMKNQTRWGPGACSFSCLDQQETMKASLISSGSACKNRKKDLSGMCFHGTCYPVIKNDVDIDD